MFEKITRNNTGHLNARLQIAATLGQLSRHEKANNKLNTALENHIKGLESYGQIKKL